ncbi:hypothetical protein KSS87_023800 [Heliosperma pusillum]|nr:hypothetical protein KSS87_023800 [Heliosperma pusillum]
MDYSNEVIQWSYKEEDISQKFPFFNVLKDGRIHVLASYVPDHLKVPPTDDQVTGVKIKDVKILSAVTARLFLPPPQLPQRKLPVMVYVYGGGFCRRSALSMRYTRLVANYVAQCNIIAVSVEYRRFPDHNISASYDDSWTALHWVASHSNPHSLLSNQGLALSISFSLVVSYFEPGECFNPERISEFEASHGRLGSPCEPWIRDFADLNRIFIGGNSAGANICHTMMRNVKNKGLPRGSKVEGMILVHPYFGEDNKMWMYMCPTNDGPTDPRMKPATHDLAGLQCDRVLVVVAENDGLKGAGVRYVDELKNSGWKGKVEFLENKDRGHCFHTSNYMDNEAIIINQRIKSFIHDHKNED